MKNSTFIPLLQFTVLSALWLPGVTSHGAPPANDSPGSVLSLETDTTRMSFDSARNGAIVSLVDKARGQEFVEAKGGPLLYELQLFDQSNPMGAPIRLSEADALDVTVTKEGQSVVVKVPRHKNSPIGVECRFRTEPGSSLIYARISVDNQSDAPLSGVQFPALSCPRQLGDTAEDDFLLLPRCDGSLVHSPTKENEKAVPMSQYPGIASMQVMALYDKTAGIYLATYDGEAYTKSFGFGNQETLRPVIQHIPPALAHAEWKTEYDTVLATFHGDWQTAADLYKSWAVHQSWCQQTLKKRVESGEIPKWLTEPSLFYSYRLRGKIGKEWVPNRMSQLVPLADAWHELLGSPVTMNPMSWEKRGSWVGPDYFPPLGGEAEFMKTMAELHAKGNHTLIFLSGLRWMLQRQAGEEAGTPVDVDQTAEFNQRGAASAVCTPDGKPQIWSPKVGVVRWQHAEICPITKVAREVLLDPALKCQRLGIDCVQADQLVGGWSPICYSSNHGHAAGGGNWAAKAVYSLLADIRREGKQRDSHFALSIEEPCEFFIPVLDTYHARDYAQGIWPQNETTICVPLFTYVYHEFMLGYGGESPQVSAQQNPLAMYQLGMNVVCGKIPAATVWVEDFDPHSTDPTQLRILRDHLDLWGGSAHEFLVFGERIAEEPLEVRTVPIKIFQGSDTPRRELKFPAVLHSTWRLPDGRTGTVATCIDSEPASFQLYGKTITLQPGEARFITP